MAKTIVLYDRNCFLCQQSKRWIQKIDWLHRLSWIPLQEYVKDHSISDEKVSAMKAEIHAYTPNKEEKVGYYAMRSILVRCPLTFIVALLMYIPKSGIVGKPLYRWIAKNRYRIFKSKCEEGACKLH